VVVSNVEHRKIAEKCCEELCSTPSDRHKLLSMNCWVTEMSTGTLSLRYVCTRQCRLRVYESVNTGCIMSM
jgi:hypothetical protein